MDFGINGRVALVTGGGGGMGTEVAKLLLAEGVTVAITDLEQDLVDKTVAELGTDRLVGFAADLRRTEEVERMRDQVVAAVGNPDILVHCCGVTGATGFFHEVEEQGWHDTLEVDFFAAVRVVKAFVQPMREKGWGRIVLTTSEDALQPYVDELPYCAAKAATLALMKGLSKTYGPEGVLVNSVSPAFIATPMTDTMMTKRATENGTSFDEAITSFLDEERPFMALHRRGLAVEVANVMAFLCSERASFVNGSNYRVDSGSVATI